MARFLLIIVIAAAVFTVFSIIDCAVQPATRHRGVSKPFWIVITLVPVIGGILWFLLGRSRGPASSFAVPDAPGDDPSFVHDGQPSEADERIRRLEEELRRLDEEETSSGRAPDEQGDGPDGEARPQRNNGNGDGANGRPDTRA